jgi:phosphosulfolactate phosphohydrolase-like enzyme
MVGVGPVGLVVVGGCVVVVVLRVVVVVVRVVVVVVVVVLVDVAVEVVVVSVVPGGSSMTLPMTQNEPLGSRLGQVIPGFNSCNLVTDSPQELAKLSHVAPLPGVVANRQSTARRDRANPSPGTSPATSR